MLIVMKFDGRQCGNIKFQNIFLSGHARPANQSIKTCPHETMLAALNLVKKT